MTWGHPGSSWMTAGSLDDPGPESDPRPEKRTHACAGGHANMHPHMQQVRVCALAQHTDRRGE
eukprot:4052852-Alexandrium_andersonii.AAC.1